MQFNEFEYHLASSRLRQMKHRKQHISLLRGH